ncbi:MAG: DNA-3-methyladenine glycosylase family protein [Rhodospirillaceae bacterium]
MKTPAYWTTATRELGARDETLSGLVRQCEAYIVGSRGDAFTTLARSIVGQQISVKAAQSVWARLRAELGTIAPHTLIAKDIAQLRGCGLSGQKAAYLLDLGQRFASGALDPARWSKLDDEAIIEELVQVKGIGRWTAEMFLIFYLARPDVFPVADVGLQRAISLHYNRGKPVSRSKMAKIGASWAPWRSVATWYMWRSLDAAPLKK